MQFQNLLFRQVFYNFSSSSSCLYRELMFYILFGGCWYLILQSQRMLELEKFNISHNTWNFKPIQCVPIRLLNFRFAKLFCGVSFCKQQHFLNSATSQINNKLMHKPFWGLTDTLNPIKKKTFMIMFLKIDLSLKRVRFFFKFLWRIKNPRGFWIKFDFFAI